MANLDEQRQFVFDDMMRWFLLADTVNSTRDSLINFIENEDDVYFNFALMRLYMKYGDYSNAQNVFNEIENLVSYLAKDQQTSIIPYLFIPQLQIELMMEESESLRLVLFNQHREQLEAYANENQAMGQVEAQKLLEEYGAEPYPERILLPDPFFERSVTNRTGESWKPQFSDLVKVTPNPANTYIDVEYAFVGEIPKQIEILSPQGAVVKEVNIGNQLGKIRISITNFAPGVYLVRAGKSCKTFVIIR